ncbi:uncharacterized protein [Centruroides vittatus]|uniref:uncharacterized protein n=1 Tax=Centruroides vittatus TaxID=120091 RepID=UPI0035103A5D
MESEEINSLQSGLEESKPLNANMMIIDSSTIKQAVSQVDINLENAIERNCMVETTDGSLPITLVVSESPILEHINENVNLGDSSQEGSVISTVNMQDGESTAQFFIEHIAADGSQLQTSESETIQIGVNTTANNNEDGVPILLHMTEDTNEDHQTNLHISEADGSESISVTTNADVGDMPATMYTIHLTEDPPPDGIVSDEQGTLTASNSDLAVGDSSLVHLENVSLTEETNLHFLATSTRLEDFMDVVTTYKCKFCRFCCAWKSGLMSHIRSCHLDASQNIASTLQESNSLQQITNIESKDKNEAKTNAFIEENKTEVPKEFDGETENALSSSQLNSDSKLDMECSNDISDSGTSQVTAAFPVQEQHIYLCGQCSRGFVSLEGCRKHINKDHNLKLAANNKSTGMKRRGRPRTKMLLNNSTSFLQDENDDDDEEDEDEALGNEMDGNNYMENGQDESDERMESSGKRRVRPPRALEEDYYFGQKKRRVRKKSTKDRTYRCNEKGCGYSFTSEANLQYHGRSHMSDDKPFCCPECDEKADHWRGLAMHLWKIHSIDMDLHTCPICGYKTYSLFKLDNHKRIHSEDREFICTTCGKGFKQLSQLRNHNVIHLDRKNMPEKRWYSEQECDICHRTFSDSKCLRKHQQAVHNKLKPYSCTYCGHMSARKAMLQLHMRQHTGEKPFMCEHCEYRTGDHNSLRRHRMRHTGTKPYKCPHCPYACIQAISYKMHLKNKHPGMEGLYACALCTFRSVSKDNYINHMSDHKRGAIPTTSTSSFHLSTATGNQHSVLMDEDSNGQQEIQEPAQLHITEGTLQQLEGILPGNFSAAQLIYSCLSALNHEGGTVNLPAGVTTTTTAGDGTQTITIQLPAPTTQEMAEHEQFYLTIQQQDGSNPTTIISPSVEVGNVQTVDNSSEKILQPITISEEKHALDFVEASDSTPPTIVSLPAQSESTSSLLQEV